MAWNLRNSLRAWQEEALNQWLDNGSKGIAKVVTGGGKTFFAFACMLEISKLHPKCVFLLSYQQLH